MSVGPLVCRDERQRHMQALATEQAWIHAEFLRDKARQQRAASVPAMPSRCSGCGSSDFVRHNGRHVCAYCRRAP